MLKRHGLSGQRWTKISAYPVLYYPVLNIFLSNWISYCHITPRTFQQAVKTKQTVQVATMNVIMKYYKWSHHYRTRWCTPKILQWNWSLQQIQQQQCIGMSTWIWKSFNKECQRLHINYSHHDQVLNNSEVSRIPLGHFVENINIWSHTHHISLMGLMQLVYLNTNGVLTSIGYTNDLFGSVKTFMLFSKEIDTHHSSDWGAWRYPRQGTDILFYF